MGRFLLEFLSPTARFFKGWFNSEGSAVRSRRITFGVVVLLQAGGLWMKSWVGQAPSRSCLFQLLEDLGKQPHFVIEVKGRKIMHCWDVGVIYDVQGMLFATLSQWMGMLVKLSAKMFAKKEKWWTKRNCLLMAVFILKSWSHAFIFSKVCFGVVLLACLRPDWASLSQDICIFFRDCFGHASQPKSWTANRKVDRFRPHSMVLQNLGGFVSACFQQIGAALPTSLCQPNGRPTRPYVIPMSGKLVRMYDGESSKLSIKATKYFLNQAKSAANVVCRKGFRLCPSSSVNRILLSKQKATWNSTRETTHICINHHEAAPKFMSTC